MHKKVSVVVPVYKAEEYLERFMDSVLVQTMSRSDFEVIMVDDGSPDDSGRMIDVYAGRYEFVRALHQTNAGPAAARNAGLNVAVGEYVAFVDPDDLLEPKYLEASYEHAVNNCADIVLFDAYKERVCGDHVKREMNSHAEYGFTTADPECLKSMQRQILYPYMAAKVSDMSFHKNVPLAAPWDKLYRREFLIDNDIAFPEHLRVLDDMCFNFIAFGAAKKISYIPTFLYDYRVEENSITNSYRADRLPQDMKVFLHLESEIKAMHLDKADEKRFYQALYARIIKSFAIAMRLYFFNPGNPKSEKEIYAEIRQYIENAPYDEAFKKVRLWNLEPKLVAVTLACRLKAVGILKVMYRMEYGK